MQHRRPEPRPIIPIAVMLGTLVLALPAQGGATQEMDIPDVVGRLLGRESKDRATEEDDRRRSLLPTIGARPESGASFGVLLSTQGRASPDAPLRSITLSASYSTKRRSQIIARLDMPTADGRWRVKGDWRAYNITERTYGLGSDTDADVFADVPLTGGRIYTTVYRRVAGAFAAGIGYHFDVRRARAPDAASELSVTPDVPGVTYTSGVSTNALFDSRDNPINAARGTLGRLTFTWFPQAIGSERSWHSLQLEGRSYARLPSARRQVVAVWGLAWLTTGGDPTYFDLPSTGWDEQGRTARGYGMGRYRGRNWLDAEVEYRVDVLRNGLIGAAAFVNASTFADAASRYGPWVAGGGAGLRIKLDKRHGSNLCIDYAWGVDGSRGLFFAMNEAF